MLLPLLQSQFPQLRIVLVDNIFFGYQCDNQETCECFKLKMLADEIMVDHIKFRFGAQCTLSGTDIVAGLAAVFAKYSRGPNALPITMYDVSKLHVTVDGNPVAIPLSTYYILLHGQSWYNKFGFVSSDFDEEREVNAKLRAKPLTPQFRKKIITTVPSWSAHIPSGMTHGQLMEWIDTQLRVERKSEYYKACVLLTDYVKSHIQYDFSLTYER